MASPGTGHLRKHGQEIRLVDRAARKPDSRTDRPISNSEPHQRTYSLSTWADVFAGQRQHKWLISPPALTGNMKAKRTSGTSPRRRKPEPARRVTREHYRERYLELSPRLLEPSQRVGVALGLLLEDGTLPPGKASSATRIIDLVATLTNAVERRPNVAETSLMVAVLDALASPDARYRRTHNKLAKNLPKAEFRGKLVQPSPAEISRDAEARWELLALAAGLEGDRRPTCCPCCLRCSGRWGRSRMTHCRARRLYLTRKRPRCRPPRPGTQTAMSRRHRHRRNRSLRLWRPIQRLGPINCRKNVQTPTVIWRATCVGCGRSNCGCHQAHSYPCRSIAQAEVDALWLGSSWCLAL